LENLRCKFPVPNSIKFGQVAWEKQLLNGRLTSRHDVVTLLFFYLQRMDGRLTCARDLKKLWSAIKVSYLVLSKFFLSLHSRGKAGHFQIFKVGFCRNLESWNFARLLYCSHTILVLQFPLLRAQIQAVSRSELLLEFWQSFT